MISREGLKTSNPPTPYSSQSPPRSPKLEEEMTPIWSPTKEETHPSVFLNIPKALLSSYSPPGSLSCIDD